MNALKLQTTIDENAAKALPKLRPFLGRKVDMTVALAEPAVEPAHRLSLEELLVKRVDAPQGAQPLTDADIEQAIMRGALGEDA